MRVRRAMPALLVPVTLIPAGPARAAEPTVESRIAPAFTRWLQEGDTVVAGGLCQARGVGATPTQVAVATRIRCSINGTVRTASAPGSVAATTIVVAAVPPVVMCHGGSAIFLETADGANELVSVDVPDRCFVFPV